MMRPDVEFSGSELVIPMQFHRCAQKPLGLLCGTQINPPFNNPCQKHTLPLTTKNNQDSRRSNGCC